MQNHNSSVQDLLREVLSLREVLNNVGAHIYTKDTAGNYTYANNMVCELFGGQLADVVGKDDSHFFDLAVSDQLRLNDRRVLEHGETLASEELNIIKASGETRIYWTVKAPVRDEQGDIIGMCGISTDITERKRLEGELREQRQLLDTVLNNVDSYIYMKSEDRRFLYVNERTARLLGRPPQDIVGKLDSEVACRKIADQWWAMDCKVFETGGKIASGEEFANENGQSSYYWSVKVPIVLQGQPKALIGFSTDITELQLLKKELERQALTDMLTGVSNRRHFMQCLEREFGRARRYGKSLAVMILDIDHFKRINDSHGHLAGDRVLSTVASHLQGLMRQHDILSRIGGEEFAIVLPETDAEGACILAGRLCESVRALKIGSEEGRDIGLTVSIGVSALQPSTADSQTMLQMADKALYLSKDAGRDRSCLLM
ncbi:diguanylate cyclase [Vogesella sp. LIG4]|uniref:sensor domain-containing diguanylate cyclase n=1 Tax=Vogesella sp. LIG4 TaxID=1192162 RepID=UPI00081FF754|nr:diguanylate cyclase [Vogesella sp. LIG4]SCK11418.1 PAS domain S-box-containing protein/diguanylate cyclase (GGDEF) domain-containing protein [Vogesella sp. LIG4]